VSHLLFLYIVSSYSSDCSGCGGSTQTITITEKETESMSTNRVDVDVGKPSIGFGGWTTT
jgi:hypothetical protein